MELPNQTTMAVADLVKAKAQYNPRHIDQAEYERLRASIERWGLVDPVVFNERTGTIVGGHQRIDAAESLGIETAPVAIVDLSENEERALNLALNKISGQWDWDALRGVMDTLDPELLEASGFTPEELKALEEDGDLLHLELDRVQRALDGSQSENGGESSAAPAAPSLADRFLVPPFSVLDGRAGYWQERKREWLRLGIRSEVGRSGSGAFGTEGNIAGGTTGTSIFDPVLCEIAYRWFAPPGGLVLDPFAGGSVRGVVSSLLGREYHGVELRKEQVSANAEQAKDICPNDGFPAPTWITGDSLIDLPDGPFDLVFSCPPYHDLEVYSDDPADISSMNWPEFLEAYREIVRQSIERLRDDRFAVWVVSEVRDKRGLCRGLVPASIGAFQDAGAVLYNEAVMVAPAGTLPQRAARAFCPSRKLGRTHQAVLVFCKGDPARAARAVGDLGDLDLPELQEAPVFEEANG